MVRVIKGKNHTEMIRKGNKNYFELEGGSTYQELKLPKGQRERNPGEMHYGSSKQGFESSRVKCIRYLWHCNIPQNTALHYITSSAPFFKASLVKGPGPATANPLSSGPQLFE